MKTGDSPKVRRRVRFRYSATLRIFGDVPDINRISRTLLLEPTHVHQKGDRMIGTTKRYPHDMWAYKVPVPETAHLSKHIDELWARIKKHKRYLLRLKTQVTVDVFLGYRSDCDHAGVSLPYSCLEMFTELRIPFEMSIIVA